MATAPHSQHPLPVLVVGAGPTGLAPACALAQRGVACRVIDRRGEAYGFARERLAVTRQTSWESHSTHRMLILRGVAGRLLASNFQV